jgi:4-hydroxy-2-oxoheptanedioate aldolase
MAALRAGRTLVGTVLTLPGATVAELLAEPFDVVWIDLEHAALGRGDAQEMILGAQAAGAFALARLPAGEAGLLTAMLDAGADGVVLADVRYVAEAVQAVRRLAHPPDGTRGWGPRRLGLRGRTNGRTPEHPSLWVQIESEGGVAHAAEIAAVPGVDALVVGTADLSFALGAPMDAAAPAVLDAIEAVAAATEDAGVAFGLAGALDGVPDDVLRRASVLVHSTDARLCARSADEAAEWLRAANGGRR